MGLFDYFSREKRKERARKARRDAMSRVEFLLDTRHEHLKAPHDAWNGLTFYELVEQQLSEGNLDLAMSNFAGQVQYCFEIAILYWGQGDLERAEAYLRKTLERHERRCMAAAEHGWPHPPNHHSAEAYTKVAAVLLGTPLQGAAPLSAFESGYQPWFDNMLLDASLGGDDFALATWQAAEDT